MTDILKQCENLGVTPSKAVTCVEDLLKFSAQIRLPEIEDYINKKTAEKRQLEREVQELEEKKSTMKKELSETEKSRELAFEQKRKVTQEMSSYVEAKQELDKHNITMNDDLPKFANTVKCVAEYGFSPQKVVSEFKDIQYLSNKGRALQIAADEKEKIVAELNRRNDALRSLINLHIERVSVYTDLGNVGFGPKELQVLLNLILNVSKSNEIDYWSAIPKFFRDIANQYMV